MTTTQLRFQFPTGWNSTEKLFAFCFIDSSFNSQRDGILPKMRYRNARAFIRFQFPTGWNSTPPEHTEGRSKDAFQFPTGWNSTLKACHFSRSVIGFQFPTGWNSTFKKGACYGICKVSIPNGMEFYFRIWTGRSIRSSFNSQRDGILPQPLRLQLPLALVSIPNGMEFY